MIRISTRPTAQDLSRRIGSIETRMVTPALSELSDTEVRFDAHADALATLITARAEIQVLQAMYQHALFAEDRGLNSREAILDALAPAPRTNPLSRSTSVTANLIEDVVEAIKTDLRQQAQRW